MDKRTGQIFVLLLSIILLHGCMFGKLKEDIQVMESVAIIGGEITTQSPLQQPLTVLIYTEFDGQKRILNFKIVKKDSGIYAFTVPAGEYFILAFEDANYNLAYDAGEYFGMVGTPDRIRSDGVATTDDLNVEVARTVGFPKGFPTDISAVKNLANVKNIAAGTIAGLDDEKFSAESAKMGLWQPVIALYNFGAGVYFLEAYDPKKIPILFVHGASGSPRNFQFLAENIDRSRYQSWFYHYPSGFPLEKASKALNYLINHLQKKYRFQKLYVTAHSMGGLVSRSFILRNTLEDGNDYIKLFVSISTPWNGHDAAKKGVEQAPAAIPSWHDMVPESPFIQSVFSEELKSRIPYYLMFSHKGDCSYFMDNNDGAVTIRSQLDLRAQKDAIKTWGFDEGHVTILSNQEVLTLYNGILERTGGAK